MTVAQEKRADRDPLVIARAANELAGRWRLAATVAAAESGRRQRDIAAALNVSQPAVAQLLSRARRWPDEWQRTPRQVALEYVAGGCRVSSRSRSSSTGHGRAVVSMTPTSRGPRRTCGGRGTSSSTSCARGCSPTPTTSTCSTTPRDRGVSAGDVELRAQVTVMPRELAGLVHTESVLILDRLRDMCLRRGENVVLEGTLVWAPAARMLLDELARRTWWPPWPGRTAGHRGCGATTGRWPRWPRTTSSASGCAPPPAGTTTPPPPGRGSRTRSPPSGPAAPHRGTCSGARSRPRPRPAAGSRVHRGAGRRRGDRLATDERTPSRPGDRLRGLPGRGDQRCRRAGALRRRQARPRPDPAQACPDRLSLLPCRVFDQHQAVQVHLPVAVVAHIHGESEYSSGAGTLLLKVLLDPQSDSLSLLLLPPPSFLTPGLDALPQQDHVDYGHADRRPLSH